MMKINSEFLQNASAPNQKHLWARFIYGAISSCLIMKNKREDIEKKKQQKDIKKRDKTKKHIQRV